MFTQDNDGSSVFPEEGVLPAVVVATVVVVVSGGGVLSLLTEVVATLTEVVVAAVVVVVLFPPISNGLAAMVVLPVELPVGSAVVMMATLEAIEVGEGVSPSEAEAGDVVGVLGCDKVGGKVAGVDGDAEEIAEIAAVTAGDGCVDGEAEEGKYVGR